MSMTSVGRRRFPLRTICAVCGFFFFLLPLAAQTETPLFGDAAIAARYVAWAEKEIAAGHWGRANAGLERGADFASESSDLSYLLGKTRDAAERPRGEVLEAYRRALETNRWEKYRAADCRLDAAETLVALRRYGEALEEINIKAEERVTAGEKSRGYFLTLRALKGLEAERNSGGEFLDTMKEALDLYPRDGTFAALLFVYARGLRDSPAFQKALPLVELVLKRLPVLTDHAPDLAWLAAPFIRDTALASRYLEEYRAKGNLPAYGKREAIPAALNLGIIGDEQAVAELFAGGRPLNQKIDKNLIAETYALLRSEEAREKMRRNLLSFSGVIIEDDDADGFADARVAFRNGLAEKYEYDADQDRVPDWNIFFNAGIPSEAMLVVPAADGEATDALLVWERYPAVLHTDYRGVRYIPRPLDFYWRPLKFAEFRAGNDVVRDFLYPVRDEFDIVLTEKSLLSFAVAAERPSAEIPGALDRAELSDGIVKGAKTFFGNKVVAETEFFPSGRPAVRRIDLDGDGRAETVIRYSRSEFGRIESTESDWDGDGIYEYAEVRQADGSVKKMWDLDQDGIRETER